ncbi:unnamed protein product [Cuscuta campestris]|uniref:Uncharacterized protein n=1 Tax=Cuscuta campestris TaxID=132261 RepID=A0A484NMT6_9ASTE|nr:unnamed protein product [Cuscuta campestris]
MLTNPYSKSDQHPKDFDVDFADFSFPTNPHFTRSLHKLESQKRESDLESECCENGGEDDEEGGSGGAGERDGSKAGGCRCGGEVEPGAVDLRAVRGGKDPREELGAVDLRAVRGGGEGSASFFLSSSFVVDNLTRCSLASFHDEGRL